MRIALFTEVFLPKIDGVVTRITRTLDVLHELGHEVLIFAPHRPPKFYKDFRVISVPSVPFRPWYPELMLGMPRPRLGRELDRFKPDVVHVINPVVLGLWGTTIAKQRNLPLLASYHTNVTDYATHLNLPLLTPISRAFLRDVHNQAHVNLCTSEPMVASAKALGIKRVRLWPKAVDTERYQPSNYSHEMRMRLSDGEVTKPLMLYVGRLSLEKRLDWLYAPLQSLPDIRLAMVGSGPAEAQLKAQFKNTATVFTGYMSGQDLAEAYASADVFAFPSTTETLGFVAMEAMASGIPVVGARAGGIPDVIQHGENGYMFTPGNLAEFSELLGNLLLDKALRERIGQQARSSVLPHNWHGSTKKLLQYYRLAQIIHKRYDPPTFY